jgi:NTP pyrophosphatase (non-canonical NTP hydrolase)
LTNHFATTGKVQQWRRDSVRTTMAEVLNLARKLVEEYGELARLRDERYGIVPQFDPSAPPATDDDIMVAHRTANSTRVKLQDILADLELVASEACTSAGRALYETLDQPMRMALRPGGPDHKLEVYRDLLESTNEARADFLSQSRIDLGIHEKGRRALEQGRSRR